jgi:hypothetical protein
VKTAAGLFEAGLGFCAMTAGVIDNGYSKRRPAAREGLAAVTAWNQHDSEFVSVANNLEATREFACITVCSRGWGDLQINCLRSKERCYTISGGGWSPPLRIGGSIREKATAALLNQFPVGQGEQSLV